MQTIYTYWFNFTRHSYMLVCCYFWLLSITVQLSLFNLMCNIIELWSHIDHLIFKMLSKTWEVDRMLLNSVKGYVKVSFPASILLCGSRWQFMFCSYKFLFWAWVMSKLSLAGGSSQGQATLPCWNFCLLLRTFLKFGNAIDKITALCIILWNMKFLSIASHATSHSQRNRRLIVKVHSIAMTMIPTPLSTDILNGINIWWLRKLNELTALLLDWSQMCCIAIVGQVNNSLGH